MKSLLQRYFMRHRVHDKSSVDADQEQVLDSTSVLDGADHHTKARDYYEQETTALAFGIATNEQKTTS